MSYNIKLSDYALLPKKSIPLDARSHFPNFAQANKAILGNVATVETADEIDNDYKQFYVGQIITTTTGNTWKVSSIQTFTIQLYIDYENKQVKWGSENNSDIVSSFKIEQVDTNLYAIFDGNDQVTNNFTRQSSSVELDTCLVPFSGSGGGGGATLKLSGTAPINVDNSNNISLSLDTNSALQVNNNKLTLSVGPGIKTVNNQITLSINENSNLSIIDDKLSVSGTHFYKTKSDDDTNVPANNYIYQEI